MRWRRISAIVIHAWHHFRHSRETWIDLFWVPVIHVLAIGGLTFYAATFGGTADFTFTALAIIMWYVIEVGSYSISVGTLWEVWSRSFTTFFISPITITEFAIGQVIFSVLKQVVIVGILSAIVYGIYGFSLAALGWMLFPYMLLLMVYGWSFGLLAFGLILRFGTSLQSLAWGLVYILQPLIGIFYPLGILPPALHTIASFLGPTYVFESARHQLSSGVPKWDYVLIAGLIDLVTLAVSYMFMRRMWEWSRVSGALARMEH